MPSNSEATPTADVAAPTGGMAKKIAQFPPHIQAGLTAYRAALAKRQDWHLAVSAAIIAADEVRIKQLEAELLDVEQQKRLHRETINILRNREDA